MGKNLDHGEYSRKNRANEFDGKNRIFSIDVSSPYSPLRKGINLQSLSEILTYSKESEKPYIEISQFDAKGDRTLHCKDSVVDITMPVKSGDTALIYWKHNHQKVDINPQFLVSTDPTFDGLWQGSDIYTTMDLTREEYSKGFVGIREIQIENKTLKPFFNLKPMAAHRQILSFAHLGNRDSYSGRIGALKVILHVWKGDDIKIKVKLNDFSNYIGKYFLYFNEKYMSEVREIFIPNDARVGMVIRIPAVLRKTEKWANFPGDLVLVFDE